MEDHEFDLSRRKVLGALGAVGAASAGAGVGTSALFSDTESFENNTLAAGELDLKVDWQQTYHGQYAWENDIEGGVPINAYPDTNGDGMQDYNGVTYGGPDASDDISDLPGACCDCDDDEFLLVYGDESWCIDAIEREMTIEEFYDYSNYNYNGDYAFVDEDTTSVFLYRNTGDDNLYLVLINDTPESDDGGTAEVAVWGLDGSAPSWVVQDDEEPAVDNYVDDPPSAEWIWQSEHTDGGAVGVLPSDFTMQVDLAFGANSIRKLRVFDGDVDDSIVLEGPDGSPTNDDEPLGDVAPMTFSTECSIESGDGLPEDVFSAPNRSGDFGGPVEQDHLVELSDVKPGDSGEITFSLHLCDNPGYIWLDALTLEEGGGTNTEPERDAEGDDDNDANLAEEIEVTVWYDEDCDNELDEGEVVVETSTLAALFDEERVPINGSGEAGSHDCMQPGGMCVGFEWEVPTGVGNEIQGDTLSFDLGFYTEQCRHNEPTTEAPR